MKTFSDGSPRTLGKLLKYADLFGPNAITFVKNKIAESPDGEKQEVLADESQLIWMLKNMGEQG
jgi:hypothetical protein